ncbi:hypothetical protein C8R44DRAFT_726908 [Mycena epipterygia]|nr:hypothetical protein C8R44DRAFT_726908 [Mycena epipterygia]
MAPTALPLDAQSPLLRFIIHLNPFQQNYCMIKTLYSQSEGTDALNKIREFLIKTIREPLDTVCDKLCANSDHQVMFTFAVLRKFIRDNNLAFKDCRGFRSFWKRVDDLYSEKRSEFGKSFDTPGWIDYLNETLDEDELHAPTARVEQPTGHEIPLFTWAPLRGAELDRFRIPYLLN